MDIAISIISWIGVTLSLSGFMFQAYKTISNKHTEGLSVITFSTVYLGTIIWLVFSLFSGIMQTMVVNIFVSLPTSLIIYMIYRNKTNNVIKSKMLLTALMSLPLILGTMMLVNLYGVEYVSFNSNALNMAVMFTAGIVGSSSFVPQLIKTVKYKHTEDLSYGLTATNGVAQIFWGMFWFMKSSNSQLGDWLAGAIFATILGVIQWTIVYLKYRNEKGTK